MRYVSIDDIEPGQLLGKTVYSANGTVLLSAGVQLTVYMINTLNRIGVTMLYIKDDNYADVEIPETLSAQTRKAIFRDMTDTFSAIRSGKDWSTKKISMSVDQLLKDVLDHKGILIHLNDIRTADNAQYIHATNVCLLSSTIGLNMGLNFNQLKELAIGGLLHDIGKTVPLPPGGSEGNLKYHHTWRGFEVLKQKRELSLLIAHTALQHHEKPDGTGIPRGLHNDDIHQYPKIVAVANRYDNLVGNGLAGLGKIMLPHEACEKMMAASEHDLDRDILIEFNRIISVYPNGTAVRLSSKETGVVVRQHRGLPGRPVVRIVRGTGEDIVVKEVDLGQHTTLFIEAVLA
ncbi:HD-GYP domain-containing protein (c-di-GMP phosphodiesterase class II) [Paenibacillus shirakamiensis]|uniref:HD-GYP domain-containing protein (C-di-GMP phosphodiesterase class II) n=1 Tax=Paenibacillus shirakamiensis TaxID=1265935 RepID=A0ABS4JKU5_9BACL|nr:HD domain-containing phosphohydrolase [Paenibacillus shirakamiensis]MBP2001700.1 HD-GYP domain-containing protein (c-di-GMP phosphodiesterase class II) [Paenibacillus shirakamiensis]